MLQDERLQMAIRISRLEAELSSRIRRLENEVSLMFSFKFAYFFSHQYEPQVKLVRPIS